MIKSAMSHGFMRWVALASLVALLVGCAAQPPAPVRQAGQPPGTATVATQPPAQATAQQIHVVRPGDTLMGIGRLYGQTVRDLAAWNALSDPNQLRVGQQIRVSPPVAGVPGGGVAMTRPIDMSGSAAPAATPGGVPVFDEPRGGRQPYSDQAWAAVRPDAVAAAQATPPTEPPTGTAAATPPAAGSSQWIWPASGPILSRFGERNSVNQPIQGLIIGGNVGDPVVAAAAGTVAYAGSGLRGYGNLVIIQHGDVFVTAYGHNQRLLVNEGDTVRQGQPIAELGSTDAERPQLQFQVRSNGQPLDPLTVLPSR